MRTYKNIDLGCAIKKHAFVVNQKDDDVSSLKHASGNETILAFFYMILDELYKLGTVAGIDIREYANATLTDIFFDIENN